MMDSARIDGIDDEDDDEHIEQVEVHVAALDRAGQVGERLDEADQRPVQVTVEDRRDVESGMEAAQSTCTSRSRNPSTCFA